MKNLLLDTCALIWLSGYDSQLSKETLSRIDSAESVYVSVMSAWELSLLSIREKIKFPKPARKWFDNFVLAKDIDVLNLSRKIVFQANELEWHHRDPADRFIIATALCHDLEIVTHDKKFKLYPVDIVV